MKYLFIDANNRVSYDEDNYYLNGRSMSNESGVNTAAVICYASLYVKIPI